MLSSPRVDRRPLAERARPQKLDELVGNPEAVDRLRRWGSAWARSGSPPAKRAALLEGPAGVGKTSAALALANELGWTVVEMNASDARNQGTIDAVAGRAALTHTLAEGSAYRRNARTLILLDEADCLTGRLTDTAMPRATPTNFRQFLRTRYGTLEALAEAWGLGSPKAPKPFDSWDDVPATAGRGAWTKLPAAQRDVSDWKGAGQSHDLSDRGGLGAIARLVRETRQPLILTVNDPTPLTRYSPVFRQAVERVRFSPVHEVELRQLLRKIALQEGFSIASAAVDAIVRRSEGDVRGAINDLEAISCIPAGAAQVHALAPREKQTDFAAWTEEVLEHPRYYRSVEIQDRIDATPDDLLPWIEESVPHFARDRAHRVAAYERLERAELFLARARRHRVWGLWSYATEMMTGGVSLALDSPFRDGQGGVGGFPQFLGEMGRSKASRALRTSILDKIDRRCHLSRRKGIEAYLPFLEHVFRAPTRGTASSGRLPLRRALVRELELTAEEVAFLLQREPDSREVIDLIGASDASEEAPRRGRARSGAPPAASATSPETEARRKVQKSLGEF